MTRRVLILGGTGDARRVALALGGDPAFRVTLSLAGRTADPLPVPGGVTIRSGGFGGAAGLAAFIEVQAVELLVDATHPFAARISGNIADAARLTKTPLIVLDRPAWEPRAGDRWIEVGSAAEAAERLGRAPCRVFLAIGRQEVGAFEAAPQHDYVVRSVDPADLPPALWNARRIEARGPFDEKRERALLEAERIDIVVAKNSGGDATYGKIAAARALELPVIMVRRPAAVDWSSAVVLQSVPAVIEALRHAPRPADRGA